MRRRAPLKRIGDWQIVGNDGHIMTDGRGFVFYVSTSESSRRWTGLVLTNGIATKRRFNSGPGTFQGADRLTDQGSLVRFRQPFEVKAALVIAVLRETAKAKAFCRELDACFVVRDPNGQKLAYIYFEDERRWRSAAKLLTRGEARRIAVNVAKSPELF